MCQSARDPALRQKNMERFREALLTEVVPAVEKAWQVGFSTALGRGAPPLLQVAMPSPPVKPVGFRRNES